MARLHRVSQTLISTAVAAVALIVAVSLGEVVVRLVAPQAARIQTPGIYQVDSLTGWRLTPNHIGTQSNRVEYTVHIRSDANGLRVPLAGARPTRARKILLLGDSFGFGQGVEAESTMAMVMERDLEAQGDSLSILNGSVPGYGTFQEAAALARRGPEISPDAAIIAVFLGNDFEDNLAPPERRFGETVQAPSRHAWFSPASNWAYAHLHLYALARGAVVAMSNAPQRRGKPEWAEMRDRYGPPDNTLGTEVDAMARALGEVRQTSAALHVPVVLAVVPEVVQVEPKRQAQLRRAVPDSVPLDFAQPNRIVRHLADSLGLPTIDLTAGLRAAASTGREFYYPLDRHWTAAGNTLAGNLLASELLQRHLLPNGRASIAAPAR